MRWRDRKLTRQPGRLWSPSHASTQPCTAALLRALQLAVVSDHEGLLRAENARRHLRIPSASFVTVRTTSLDSVALWLTKGASWGWAQGLQTGTLWAGASLHTYCVLPALTRKKKFKNLPTFKNRECSVKTPTVGELSHRKGSLLGINYSGKVR